MKNKLSAVLLLSTLWACNPKEEQAAEEDTRGIIEFKGREIDLKPYFEGFPYSRFMPMYKIGKMAYFYATDSATYFYCKDMAPNIDLATGRKVSDIDFSKRNIGTVRYHEPDTCLYWNGDENNDEIMNLYRFNPRTGEAEKLTDVEYNFGYRWNEDESTIAYIPRLGTKDEQKSEVRLYDITSATEKTVSVDNPGMTFTWCSPSWRPDGKGLVVVGLKDAHRNYANLLYVDLENPTPENNIKCLTDKETVRRGVDVYSKWLNNDEFLYTSNESGYTNVHKFNIATGEATQLTKFDLDLSDFCMLEVDGEDLLFCIVSSPIKTKLSLIDPATGEVIREENTDFGYGILDHEGNKMLLSAQSTTTRFRIDEYTITKDDFKFDVFLGLSDELKSQLVKAEVERVEFPTFDIDPNTGDTRMLHGYLYKPKNPLPKEDAICLIQSFYGGYNAWHPRVQILADAGIYVFSPSPRGCSGFGKEFYALNDGDLGGNEIMDIIYAGKYIRDRLKISPKRIGVFGGSHGGYAVMRLLSTPYELNGLEANYEWGFGISHAGFSDIIHFYETCNIPTWVTLEAGDPKTEREKLIDRSPLYDAKDFKGKLLLTHGTNDSRVPIEGSRYMRDSLVKYGKDVRLVEFEGQGHGIKGLERNMKNFEVWFEFLNELEK
jgi:dipeptidyl aminopeptidase/acylaminoacyl peptidase